MAAVRRASYWVSSAGRERRDLMVESWVNIRNDGEEE
jgi:hypothetical protein